MSATSKAVAPVAAHAQGPFTTEYYLKAALAGAICCSITHGALCPVDVVKTRMQVSTDQQQQMRSCICMRIRASFSFVSHCSSLLLVPSVLSPA